MRGNRMIVMTGSRGCTVTFAVIGTMSMVVVVIVVIVMCMRRRRRVRLAVVSGGMTMRHDLQQVGDSQCQDDASPEEPRGFQDSHVHNPDKIGSETRSVKSFEFVGRLSPYPYIHPPNSQDFQPPRPQTNDGIDSRGIKARSPARH